MTPHTELDLAAFERKWNCMLFEWDRDPILNAALCTEARTDLPALVQEVKRLTAKKDCECGWAAAAEWEKQCDHLKGTLETVTKGSFDGMAALANDMAVLRADNARLQSENDEWNCIFDLTHAAQARALLRWREQDPEGRRLKLPNIEDHTIWCFERIETLTADNARLREAVTDVLDNGTVKGAWAHERLRAALANDSEKLKGS